MPPPPDLLPEFVGGQTAPFHVDARRLARDLEPRFEPVVERTRTVLGGQ
jgi:hypothetical protein